RSPVQRLQFSKSLVSEKSKPDTKIEIDDVPAAERVGSTVSSSNIYRPPLLELQHCGGVVVAHEIAGRTVHFQAPNRTARRRWQAHCWYTSRADDGRMGYPCETGIHTMNRRTTNDASLTQERSSAADRPVLP